MAFDKNYLIPAAVALYSLFERLQKSKDEGKEAAYTIHIFYAGLQEADMQRLKDLAKPYGNFITLDFIDIGGFLEKFHNPFSDAFLARFSKMVLIKYILVDFFPQYDKIIWTDVDVVFLQDPTLDFIKMDAAQPVYLHAVFTSEEEHALEGFWFCNLAYMRAHSWTQKVLECIQKRQRHLNEPDLITFVWPNEIARLPLKYCVMPPFYEGRCLDAIHPLDVPQLQESLENPIILHYCDFHGVPKPWYMPFSVKSGLWLTTLSKTPLSCDFFLDWDARQAQFTQEMVHQHYFSIKHSTLHLLFKTPCRFLCAYYKAVKHRLFSRGVLDLARRVRYKILGGGGGNRGPKTNLEAKKRPNPFQKINGN
ncbi:glycosyltransferase family 8 protein, partial [Helicobacter ailurogastricus]|uniref:glycosyltransferase family 8 protein n=1 Tax=Helicobacter ailurogastricus TaxID=1578720 RepID=UPI00248FB3D1